MFFLRRKVSVISDEQLERQRYDKYALEESRIIDIGNSQDALSDIAELHKAPFLKYYEEVSRKIKPGMRVLELGAGTGRHTSVIYRDDVKIIALDISEKSLALCKRRIPGIQTLVASMESIPLQSKSIDMIISSGSLSYGDPDLVDEEIFRLLKPGGYLIVLDSLNVNLIYRFNRWLHYVKGKRSKSTITRMPDSRRIEFLSSRFSNSELFYFGSYLPIIEMLKVFIGKEKAYKINYKLEEMFPSKKNAFKFILVCSGLDN